MSLINTKNTKQSNHFNIVVEGNIGCGKSELLDFLSDQKLIEVFPEPLEKWQDMNGLNFFDLYYKDPMEYALPFQFLTMLTMLQRNIRASKKKDKSIHVFERSLNSSRQVFIETLKSEQCIDFNSSRVINKWYNFLEEQYNLKPDLIVYIRTSPEKLMKRIQQRGRSEEREIELHFLREIHDNYEAWLKSTENIPIIILNGDTVLDKLKTEYDVCLSKITKHYINKMNA